MSKNNPAQKLEETTCAVHQKDGTTARTCKPIHHRRGSVEQFKADQGKCRGRSILAETAAGEGHFDRRQWRVGSHADAK